MKFFEIKPFIMLDTALKPFKLQELDEGAAGEVCEECGAELSPDGTCPVCSPEREDEELSDFEKDLE